MKDKFQIRPMTMADLEQILEIEKKIFSAPFSKALFEKFLTSGSYFNWVAELVRHSHESGNPVIVGYIMYSLVIDGADLINIAVVPDFRQRGIGRSLMDHMLGELKRLGGKKIFLDVRPSNEVARRLYKKYGFLEIARRPNYYEDNGEDAIVYLREL